VVDDLRRLAEAATPGPWETIGNLVCRGLGGVARVENDGTDYSTGEPLSDEAIEATEQADAAYIAAANPQTILALLDEREALQAKHDSLRAYLTTNIEAWSDDDGTLTGRAFLDVFQKVINVLDTGHPLRPLDAATE
jgi:hypothetical protein